MSSTTASPTATVVGEEKETPARKEEGGVNGGSVPAAATENAPVPVAAPATASPTATVAGEDTSEVGEKEETKVSANEDFESDKKPSSFLKKRGRFATMKVMMFVLIACGLIYLAYNGCSMKLLLMWELLKYFGQSALALVTFLFKKVWCLVNNYPIYTFGAFVLWKRAALIQRKRKHRAKVRELFGAVLQAVYDRLSESEDNEGYPGLFLRDDVLHDMYPTNLLDRLFVYNYVWPRVALEIQANNRVQKFRGVANGKDLEHWDFEVLSKRGWILRQYGYSPQVV